MRPARPLLLFVSIGVSILILAGGFAVRVGAGENSYQQVVLFSEILSLVVDNYVDPVETDALLTSAYEGLLGSLDANGAYLTPDEVTEWKTADAASVAHPGFAVLKAGRALQVVALEPGSPAEAGGIQVGDQIRAVDGRPVRDLSLTQAWRLILGEPGSDVSLDLLHPLDGFRREELTVPRKTTEAPTYVADVRDGVAVVRIYDMARLDIDALASEMDDLRSRGIEVLLLDLRNLADLRPSFVERAGQLFTGEPLLRLRDRSGRLVDEVGGSEGNPAWTGDLAVLVNGATAGSAEALASVIQSELEGVILGESTYGLGARAELYELEDGSGLVVSSALWETPSGQQWNDEGVEPDHEVSGEGDDYEAMTKDQLEQALQWLRDRQATPEQDAAAA